MDPTDTSTAHQTDWHRKKPLFGTLSILLLGGLLVGVSCDQGAPNDIQVDHSALTSAAPAKMSQAQVAAIGAQMDQAKATYKQRALAGASPTELAGLRKNVSDLRQQLPKPTPASKTMGPSPKAATAIKKAPPSDAAIAAYLEIAKKHDRNDPNAVAELHSTKIRMLGQ